MVNLLPHWSTDWLVISNSWSIFQPSVDQSMITSCSKIWSMADLLVRLTISWINWLIGSLINLLFKNLFRFAALPTPTTSDCPRFKTKIVSGPHSGPLVAPSLNQLNNLVELKFNLLNDSPQRWPCGALFCRLLVETCNSSTTEWYTCLNNQNCSSYFLWRLIFTERVRYLNKSEKDGNVENGKMV